MSYKAIDIANKILSEKKVSNMKLQKLLYYQQGFHLAYFDTPLFEEEIEAWMYGPVVPNIYASFKDNGRCIIPTKGIDLMDFKNHDEKRLFEKVNDVFGKFSAEQLMDMTHQEYPWLSTNIGKGSIIDKKKMLKYFSQRIKQ